LARRDPCSSFHSEAGPSKATRMVKGLRPILNFTPGGKLWPPGAKLSPRGEFVP
jgi:hypothetical protein